MDRGSRSAERTAAPPKSETASKPPSGCETSAPQPPPRRSPSGPCASVGDRCEPPVDVRRPASHPRTPTVTHRTLPTPRLQSAASLLCEAAPSTDPKPTLAPPAKPHYRCSCAVCSSCRNRGKANSISAKTHRTTQPIRTPLWTVAQTFGGRVWRGWRSLS